MNTKIAIIAAAMLLAACSLLPTARRSEAPRPAAPVVVEPRVVVKHVREEAPSPATALITPVPSTSLPAVVATTTPAPAQVTPTTTATVEPRQPKSDSLTGLIVKGFVQSMLDAPRKQPVETTVTLALPDGLTTETLAKAAANGTGKPSKPPYAFFIALIGVFLLQWMAGKLGKKKA